MSQKIIRLFVLLLIAFSSSHVGAQRPNILFVVSDDQSFPHASAYGSKMVSTPGFDAIAKQGALFKNAYVTSPGCSPSRASMLTGLYPWQIEDAGSHAGSFSSTYTCFPDILEKAGYKIGYTGKGWAPGNWKASGRTHNPAGPEYNTHTLTPLYSGISPIDYAANFKQFLSERKPGQPFYFWLGTHEPHRPFEESSWIKKGYSIDQANVPAFLPDNNIIKSDLLDYATEISWFDSQLANCINELKRLGEFDNTIIIVTSDNGMSFPYAKANCTDAGIHVPLAICWGKKINSGQVVDALVSSIDFAPTILEATGLSGSQVLSGQSLLPLLNGNAKKYTANAVYAGRERHSFSRYNNLGYPMRSIRWKHYLLVRNFHPERWPAGDPKETLPDNSLHDAYYDIDDGPTKDYMVKHQNDSSVIAYFNASMGRKRPEYELYDLQNDVGCLQNVAGEKACARILTTMKKMLNDKLVQTNDTRLGNNPNVWDTYPRLEGPMRNYSNQQ